jgi:hypothetical protein
MRHPVGELISMAAEIRHVRAERERRPDDSSWFRLHGAQLDELHGRFELWVDRWAIASCREAWRTYRDGGGEAPEVEPAEPAPLWWGRASTGSVLEILPPKPGERPRRGSGARVRLDGDRLPRSVSCHQELVTIGDLEYREGSRCPPEALEALRQFMGDGGEPPWTWARTLLDDGLVDRDLSLTDRGRRLVQAMGGPASAPGPRWARWAAG